MNYKRILLTTSVFCLVFSLFQSCTTGSNNINEIVFESGFENAIENYKAKFGAEGVDVLPMKGKKSKHEMLGDDSSPVNNDDTLEFIQITIFESQNLPESNIELSEMSLDFAKEVYESVINKDDFIEIKVEFAFKEGELCDLYRQIKFTFPYEELR